MYTHYFKCKSIYIVVNMLYIHWTRTFAKFVELAAPTEFLTRHSYRPESKRVTFLTNNTVDSVLMLSSRELPLLLPDLLVLTYFGKFALFMPYLTPAPFIEYVFDDDP